MAKIKINPNQGMFEISEEDGTLSVRIGSRNEGDNDGIIISAEDRRTEHVELLADSADSNTAGTSTIQDTRTDAVLHPILSEQQSDQKGNQSILDGDSRRPGETTGVAQQSRKSVQRRREMRDGGGGSSGRSRRQVLHVSGESGADGDARGDNRLGGRLQPENGVGITQGQSNLRGSTARHHSQESAGLNFTINSQADLAPLSARERILANLSALELIYTINQADRLASFNEQQILARFGSWGGVPEIFDEQNNTYVNERARLKELLTPEEYAAARKATINAHYTNPDFAKIMWRTLQDLGLDEANRRILEPGSGSGVFMGTAPTNIDMVGVELDPIAAKITSHLYPNFSTRQEDYAKTNIPDNYFDASIGNVPFANIRLFDPVHNQENFSIHNHFINKSLDFVKPGGLAAFITSTYTMDSKTNKHREIIGKKADLLGAIRLPAGAFWESARTEAMTDILFFRKHEAGQTNEFTASWSNLKSFTTNDNNTTTINQYFANNPDHIIGDTSVGTNQFGVEVLQVKFSGNNEELVSKVENAANQIVIDAKDKNLTFNTTPVDYNIKLVTANELNQEGHIKVVDPYAPKSRLEFTIINQGITEELKVTDKYKEELRDLLFLRDKTVELLDIEAKTSDDTSELDVLRQDLNQLYDNYYEKYGALNRAGTKEKAITDQILEGSDAEDYIVKEREKYNNTTYPTIEKQEAALKKIQKYEEGLEKKGFIEGKFGATETIRVSLPVMKYFKQDPHYAITLAIENYDFEEEVATKASVLSKRIVSPRQIATSADNPLDAIQISLNTTGQVNLETVAKLLHVSQEEALEQLKPYVFEDPKDINNLIPKSEYLSGNIYQKIEEIENLTNENPNVYGRHLEALREILPTPLTPEEISPRLGAAWIDKDTVQQFVRELLNDRNAEVYTNGKGSWNVKGTHTTSITAKQTWGVDKRNGYNLIRNILNRDTIKINMDVIGEDGKKKTVTNVEQTELAIAKAEEIKERFEEWAFEDPIRARNLTDVYNRQFNGTVQRDFTTEAESLTLPGLAEGFTPFPHQRIAVARMIHDPAVLLAHEVGAGKTSEMIIGAMELKRLGLVNKPVVVIPNPLLEQFSAEWLERYPTAKILPISTEDLTKDNRKKFIAKAAMNDWDAVIMTREAFIKIEVNPEFKKKYTTEKIEELRQDLEYARTTDNTKNTGGFGVKQIEQAITSYEEKIKKLLDKDKDAGIYFENTGFDYIIVDEAHGYKNLGLARSNVEVNVKGSERAQDLDMKLAYLREREGKRIATFATGTPISNAVSEVYVMNKYLRPDVLENAGCYSFGQWASTFGQEVTELEVRAGGTLKMNKRFSKFENVPELLKLWEQFTDTKTAAQLNLPTPDIALNSKGERATEQVILSRGEDLKEYVDFINKRMESFGQNVTSENGRWHNPTNDNMLSVSTDGRKAALDMRMVDDTIEKPDNPKVNSIADNIFENYEQTKDNIYTNPTTGEESLVKGGLQLVFCDISTPKANGWNFYDELKQQLVMRGIDADKIRFAHEAKTNQEKARLWNQGRNGAISVLIGSTEKMGTGVNVQTRVTAMHHVECPWRPSDITQREGRGIRQGNQNKEVKIYNYVTKQSYDAYMWQTVERKSKFIQMIMNGKLDTREIEELGEFTLSAGQAKALATGNPLLYELSEVQAQVTKLSRQERNYHKTQNMMKTVLEAGERTLTVKGARIEKIAELLPQIKDTSGENFSIKIGNEYYNKRNEAMEGLKQYIEQEQLNSGNRWNYDQHFSNAVELGGITLDAHFKYDRTYDNNEDKRRLYFTIPGIEAKEYATEGYGTFSSFSGAGFIQRLENAVAKLPAQKAEDEQVIEGTKREMAAARENLGKPFKYQDELAIATQREKEIQELLHQQAEDDQKKSENENASNETQNSSTNEEVDSVTKALETTQDFETLLELSTTGDEQTKQVIAKNPYITEQIALNLIDWGSAKVTEKLSSNENATPKVLHKIYNDTNEANYTTDESKNIYINLCNNPKTAFLTREDLAKTNIPEVRNVLAQSKLTPEEILENLSKDENPYVRFAAAGNNNTPATSLFALAKDREVYIANEARENQVYIQNKNALEQWGAYGRKMFAEDVNNRELAELPEFERFRLFAQELQFGNAIGEERPNINNVPLASNANVNLQNQSAAVKSSFSM